MRAVLACLSLHRSDSGVRLSFQLTHDAGDIGLHACSEPSRVLATGTSSGAADMLLSFIVRLASQQNDLADATSWLLLVGMFAMAMLTSNAMFSALLATIRYGIIPAVCSSLAPERAQSFNQAVRKRRTIIVITIGGGRLISFC